MSVDLARQVAELGADSLLPPSNEQRYYDALKRIAKAYRTAESLLQKGDAGLTGVEALEYAYDNLQHEASTAIRGRRRPKK